uniref:Uncharacterized protein n=1 Tax=Paramormyrops kingsleyae TaxID=1676925 RepID=A0A3B3RNM7_9TELE
MCADACRYDCWFRRDLVPQADTVLRGLDPDLSLHLQPASGCLQLVASYPLSGDEADPDMEVWATPSQPTDWPSQLADWPSQPTDWPSQLADWPLQSADWLRVSSSVHFDSIFRISASLPPPSFVLFCLTPFSLFRLIFFVVRHLGR